MLEKLVSQFSLRSIYTPIISNNSNKLNIFIYVKIHDTILCRGFHIGGQARPLKSNEGKIKIGS